MAIIPTAGLPTPISPLPGVRATTRIDPGMAAAGAAGLAPAISKAASDFYQQQVARNDSVVLMNARAKLSQWEQATYDPNNPDGVHKYVGDKALGASDELLPGLDTRIGEISKGLSRNQQDQFAGIAATFRAAQGERLNGWMTQQHEQFLTDSTQASTENLVNDAVQAGSQGDFQRSAQLIAEAQAMTRPYLAHTGANDAMIAASDRKIASAVHSSTITAMAVTNPMAAQAYYEQHEGDLTADARIRAIQIFKPFVNDAIAQDIAGGALAGAPPPTIQGPRGKPAPQVADALDNAAKASGADRATLYGLTEQESSFRPGAVNPEALDDGDHATGLLQYRKTTADALGIDRTDPAASANAAAKQLAERTSAHGIRYAIAAHYAGDKGAQAYIGSPAAYPQIDHYVDQVQGRARRWQVQFGTAAPDPNAERIDVTPQNSGATYAAPPAAAPPATIEDAIAAVDKDPRAENPLIRTAAEAQVRQQWALRQNAKEELQRSSLEAARIAVEGADPHQSLSSILGNQYAFAVQNGWVDSLQGRLDQRARGELNTGDPKMLDFYLRESYLDPGTFAKEDIRGLAGNLSLDGLRELVERQKAIRDAKAGPQWATEGQLLDQAYNSLAITGTGNETARGKFALAYLIEKRAFVQKNTREPTASEMQGMVNTLKQTVVKPGWIWDSKAQLYQNPGTGYGVPADERTKILASFAKQGVKQPTEAQIGEAYARGAGNALTP